MFGITPASLFLASVGLLVTSTPLPVGSSSTVDLRQLTKENFKQSIAEGTWYIEFFSPWCGHCKEFKPTWEKLVEARDDPPNLKLAQVDCVAYGDLCTEVAIKYYPQMRLYKDGKEMETYKETKRDMPSLEKWLDTRVGPRSVGEPEKAAEVVLEQKEEENLLIESGLFNKAGQVLVLTPETFMERTGSEPTFVKFYAPWCHHCQKLAPTWVKLAEELRGVINIAEINCEAFGSVCTKQGVQGFPMLYLYHNGQKGQYTGAKTIEAMSSYVKNAIAPGVVPATSELTSTPGISEVFYVLLHKTTDTASLSLVKQAAKVLLGTPRVYSSSDPAIWSRYRIPPNSGAVLLAVKHVKGAAYEYSAELALKEMNGDVPKLEQWMLKNKYPTTMELTIDNFMSIMKNPTAPYVVLAALPTPDGQDSLLPGYVALLQQASSQWNEHPYASDRERGSAFVWMNATRWGDWLKSQYGIKQQDLPAVVIADHKDLVYYDVDAKDRKLGLDPSQITEALQSVYDGQVNYKNSETIFERTGRRLNNFIVGIETWASEHIMMTIFSILAFAFVCVWGLRKFLDSENLPNDYVPEKNTRHGRLD